MSVPHTHGGTDAPECTTCTDQRESVEKLRLNVVYDDTLVSAEFIAEHVLELEGVLGVEAYEGK